MSISSMMESLRNRMPEIVDFGEMAISAGFIGLALVTGYIFARLVSPRISRLFAGQEELRFQQLIDKSAKILRDLVAGLFLAIVVSSYDWQLYSELILGFVMAFILAGAVYRMLRGLGAGILTATAAGAMLFIMLFSRSIGGVESVSHMLDQIGFGIGGWRFSLLLLVNIFFIGIILVALVRLTNQLVRFLLNRNDNFDPGQRVLGEKLAMVATIIVAFFVGIDLLGIDLTAFAVFSGAFGLAIGFGLQKTFGNLIAGIILLMDRSIKPGDVIALGDKFGWVNKIGIRAVSIITRDGKEHLIPNETLMTTEVENWSYSSKNVRVRIPVGVSYSADMDKVVELMLQAAGESSRVLKRPAPNVWMKEFGDSSVNFEILAWIRDPEEGMGNVRSDVLKRVWNLFKENNIEIPFPQRDLNLRNVPPELLEFWAGQAGVKTPRKPKSKIVK